MCEVYTACTALQNYYCHFTLIMASYLISYPFVLVDEGGKKIQFHSILCLGFDHDG